MQRRAVVVYVGVFLLIASGSFALLATTAQPSVSMKNPDYTLTQNQSFTVQGQQYNVTEVSTTTNEQGNIVRSATAEWLQPSANYSATLANNSTVDYKNDTYRVLIPNTTNPSKATLREVQNLSSNTTTLTQNNETFVIVNGSDGNRTLIPEEEYIRQQYGEPNTTQLTVGITFPYENNSTKVSNVSAEGVVLTWTGERTHSISFGKTNPIETTLIRGWMPTKVAYPAGGETVSLNNQTYVVSYPDNSTLQLSTNVEEFKSKVESANHKAERLAGVWGVLILSGLAAFLILMLGYLPVKG